MRIGRTHSFITRINPWFCYLTQMDDRTRYETVKSRLRVMAEGTAQQVHQSLEPSPYSIREVENTLDELVLAEADEFQKIGEVYRWTRHHRFRVGMQ